MSYRMQSTFDATSASSNHDTFTASHPCVHITTLSAQYYPHQQAEPGQAHSLSPTLHNSRRPILIFDRTAGRPTRLNALHDAYAVLVAVGHLAEDDMAAVEPGGDDGGDEELGAVGIGAGVGHAEEERLAVLELEVLVGEFLAVDGFAARALLGEAMFVSERCLLEEGNRVIG